MKINQENNIGDITANMDCFYFCWKYRDITKQFGLKLASKKIDKIRKELLKNKQLNSSLLNLIALSYEFINDKKNAYKYFDQAINSQDSDSEIWRTYYYSMLKFKEKDSLIESYIEKWIKRYPTNPRPFIAQMTFYYGNNDQENMDNCYKKAVKADFKKGNTDIQDILFLLFKEPLKNNTK